MVTVFPLTIDFAKSPRLEVDCEFDWILLCESVNELDGIVALVLVANKSPVVVLDTLLSVSALTVDVEAIDPPKILPKPKTIPLRVVVPATSQFLPALYILNRSLPLFLNNSDESFELYFTWFPPKNCVYLISHIPRV